jgi:hypothetical protein
MSWLVLLIVGLCAPDPAHPNSMSRSVLIVKGSALRHELRCQTASLLEVIEADTSEDAFLDDAELQAARDEIEAYIAAHYVLRTDTGGPLPEGDDQPEAGVVLRPTLLSLTAGEPEVGAFVTNQWIDLVFEAHHDALIGDLMLDVSLFRDTSPDHRDLCNLFWNENEPLETLFWMSESRKYFLPDDPPVARALSDWVLMGGEHILRGWDHLAFVIALIVAAGGAASVVGVVTAFTLAHSVTLALAATGLVTLPSAPVEAAIALSIAWVGFATLISRAPRARWPEAFVFGLVHGLGFAGFLGEALYGEPRRLVPLLGFNLGVEAGQLLVVLLAVIVLWIVRRALRRPAPAVAPATDVVPPASAVAPTPTWLAPTLVRVPVAALVTLAGAWWLIDRTRAMWGG